MSDEKALLLDANAITRLLDEQIQAELTRGHPNALEAAIAASHLLRWALAALWGWR